MDREQYVTNFRANYDLLLRYLSVAQENGQWNAEQDGDMAVYFTSDLMGLAVYCIASDGVFEKEEAKIYRDMFDQSITLKELQNIYQNYFEVIDDTIPHIADNYHRLVALNEEMGNVYKVLVELTATLISISDRNISDSEKVLIDRIYDAVK